jgi:NitT/TauT family transport system substrate-binding protein
MRVRLFQPFRVLLYAPIEVAQRGGFLAAEGLELDVTITGSSPRYLDALSRGEADIALGGHMRTMKWVEEGHRADVVNFAEVNSRSGFFLLSRTPQPDFQPTVLVGKEVITFAEAPTPWFCLQAVLRRHGVDPAQVHCLTDLPTPVAVETFLCGHADYLLQTQPVVERLVQDGTAFLCMAQAEACGHLAFTSYIAATTTLQTQPELIARFTRAVYRTQQWMAQHSTAEIARAIQASFPETPVDLLAAAIERFQQLGTWPADPVLRREGFENLAEVLRLAGYITSSPSYDTLVDTSIARRVMQAG